MKLIRSKQTARPARFTNPLILLRTLTQLVKLHLNRTLYIITKLPASILNKTLKHKHHQQTCPQKHISLILNQTLVNYNKRGSFTLLWDVHFENLSECAYWLFRLAVWGVILVIVLLFLLCKCLRYVPMLFLTR